MNRYFIIFFTLLVSLFQIKLESSLEREYDCDRSCKKYCPYHMKEYEEHFKCEFKLAFLKLLPEEKGECSYCKNKSIFPGYVDKQLNKYQKHLKKQIEYQQSNKPCFCLWPEKSEKAADINNAAFFLFLEAIDSEETKLSNFIDNIQEQIEFFELKLDFSAPIGYHYTPFTSYGVSVALVVKQFRFSDYYCVCKDVEAYLKPKCNWKEFESIKNKLDEILCDLYPRFFELYTSCYEKHPSADIKKEIRFMKLLVNF